MCNDMVHHKYLTASVAVQEMTVDLKDQVVDKGGLALVSTHTCACTTSSSSPVLSVNATLCCTWHCVEVVALLSSARQLNTVAACKMFHPCCS